MNELMLFKNEVFGEVRIIKVDNKELFCASDVARALGYNKPNDAVNQHCIKDGTVKHSIIDSIGRTQKANFINESNLYRLIIRSKLESAQQFEKWVFEEVLPQIRQTGGYIPVSQEDDEEALMAKALLIAQKTIEKKQQIIQQQGKQLEEQKPLVELAKKRLDKNGLISITDTTKTFELKRGKITAWAKEQGYLHKTLCEVNQKGKDYFKVYDAKGYKCIGVTELGLQHINERIEQIK